MSLGPYLVDLKNGDHLGKSSKLKKKMWKIEGGGFKKGQFSTLFQKYVEFFPSLFPTLWATHSRVRLRIFLKGKYVYFFSKVILSQARSSKKLGCIFPHRQTLVRNFPHFFFLSDLLSQVETLSAVEASHSK